MCSPLLYRIEKYRPTKLSDVVGNEETISRLEVCGLYSSFEIIIFTHTHTHVQVFAREGNVPNVIIAVSLLNIVVIF